MSTFNWFRINNKCGFWLANRFADSIPSPFLTPDSFKKESKHAPLFLQLSAHGYLHRTQRWPAYFGWENYYLLLHFHLEYFLTVSLFHALSPIDQTSIVKFLFRDEIWPNYLSLSCSLIISHFSFSPAHVTFGTVLMDVAALLLLLNFIDFRGLSMKSVKCISSDVND